jgi:hypothetical protein
VPPPVFLLLIELTKLTGDGGGVPRPAPTLEEMLAQMMPPQQVPSIEDLDDSPASSDSPNANSATSGASWEDVESAA